VQVDHVKQVTFPVKWMMYRLGVSGRVGSLGHQRKFSTFGRPSKLEESPGVGQNGWQHGSRFVRVYRFGQSNTIFQVSLSPFNIRFLTWTGRPPTHQSYGITSRRQS
jgi:hypothetical protein